MQYKGITLYEDVKPSVLAYNAEFEAIEIIASNFVCDCGIGIITNRIDKPFCPNCTKHMRRVINKRDVRAKAVETYPVIGNCDNCRLRFASLLGKEIYSKSRKINCVMCSATVDLLE